jgi:ketosteroid isomerase-like protein
MLSEEDARRFAVKWIGSWNTHDLEAILAHYAEDVEVISPLVEWRLGREDGILRGKAELREYFATGLRHVPDLHFGLRHVLAGVDGLAMIYERENGALVTEAFVLDEAGKAAQVRVYYLGLPGPPSD